MAMSIATSVNGLSGRCACCDSRLTKSPPSGSVQFQRFPSSCIPAPPSNSRHSRRSSKGPRSALDDSDYEARDNSPANAEEGPNARPFPGYKKPDKPRSGQSALARALAYRQAKDSGQQSEKATRDRALPAAQRPERPQNPPEVEIFRGQSFQSRLQSTDAASPASDSSSSPSVSAPYTSGDTSSKAGDDASPSEAENGSDPNPNPTPTPSASDTSSKAGNDASPSEAENGSDPTPTPTPTPAPSASDTLSKAGNDASPSDAENGSDPNPTPTPAPDPAPSASGDTSSKAGNEADPTEAENVSQVKSQGLSTPTPNEDVGKLREEKLGSAKRAATSSSSPEAGKKSTVSLDAFKKAQAYKQQQAEMIAALKEKPAGSEPAAKSSSSSSTSPGPGPGPKENLVEVEIVTRDGVIKKLVSPEKAFTNVKEFRRTGVSSIDFSGLGFADKKQGGRNVVRDDYQPPPPGALPEVEILTKDADPATGDGEEGDLYKPRVSTWGVFPRPADISKAYGGGRTIRPGDTLETEEERIAREAKTQKLLADYKKKMGLDVDPRLKAECEKIMKQGDSLMDSGDLKGALALFETVMEKMTFQSELHGLAALQGAICLDSLARFSEAKEIYEKLISHPNGKIRKQAKQLLYGFRAMENLKVSTSNKWDTSVYAKYFEAFADGYNTTYKASDDETTDENTEQYLAYALLLFFPILLVIVLAVSKGPSS